MMTWQTFKQKAYNAIYKAWWYPRIYLPTCVPIVVYTGAKTGTTTLRNTLYRQGVGPVFWAHGLDPDNTRKHKQYLQERGIKSNYSHFWQTQVYLRSIVPKRPIKIISSVRDAIAVDVSGFFQRFEHYYGESATAYQDKMDELQALFYREFMSGDFRREPCFERRYQETLGINVYGYPFPHDKGYLTIQHENLDILILRVETPDAIKEQALNEFLGIQGVKIYCANIGIEKDYSETYKRFRDNLVLPQSYVDAKYTQADMQHFYTPDEIKGFRSKWRTIDTL